MTQFMRISVFTIAMFGLAVGLDSSPLAMLAAILTWLEWKDRSTA